MALSLPTIQRRGADRLATPDPMRPVREAAARSAMFGAIGNAAGAVAEVSALYTERESKREVQAATLYAHEQDAAFVATHGGKEEFSIMDTEDSDFVDLADSLGYEDVNASVPSHRVYAEWRQKKYNSAMEEAASKISSASARESFLTQHKMKGQAIYADDAVAASKAQIKYSATKTMESVEKSLLNRDFGGARLAVGTSDLSTDAKERAMTLVNTREQSDYFNESIEKKDIGAMTVALTNLIKNDPRTTSNLDAETQKIFANQLRTAINSEKTAITAAVNSGLKLTTDDLKRQIDDMWGNKTVDVESMVENAKALSLSNPVLAREAKRTIDNQPIISDIVLQSPTDQMVALNKWRAESTGGMEDSYKIDQLQKAIASGQTARATDSLKWAESVGFIATDPIDYSSNVSIADSLKARVKPTLSVQQRFGTFTGFLTEDELVEFGSRLENSPNKLEFFSSINSGLGQYAEPFYEQLKKYGVGSTAPVAGQVLSRGEGYRTVADNILKGATLRKEDTLTQAKMKERKPELDAFSVQNFGGLYTGNTKQQSVMVEAFHDLYAATGDKDGSFTKLTGGVMEFNGYKVQAPVPGMSGRQYTSMIKDWAPEVWASPSMAAYGYSPSQLQKSVLDGSLKQEGLGAGVSHLVARDGSLVKRPDGVTPLKFVFDMNYPSASKGAVEAERKRKQELATEWMNNQGRKW